MTAAAAGIMICVSRLLDAFFDVVIGMTADRTKSRWGKFRPYICLEAVPLAVSAVLAFTTPAFGGHSENRLRLCHLHLFHVLVFGHQHSLYGYAGGHQRGPGRTNERLVLQIHRRITWAVSSCPPPPCRWPGISGRTAPPPEGLAYDADRLRRGGGHPLFDHFLFDPRTHQPSPRKKPPSPGTWGT